MQRGDARIDTDPEELSVRCRLRRSDAQEEKVLQTGSTPNAHVPFCQAPEANGLAQSSVSALRSPNGKDELWYLPDINEIDLVSSPSSLRFMRPALATLLRQDGEERTAKAV